MSKSVDLNKPLSEDDARYVQERPWLIRDFEMTGGEIQYAEGANPDDEESYADLTVADLKAEIAERNEERDEDNQIADKGNKAELIAALEADDEEEAEQ